MSLDEDNGRKDKELMNEAEKNPLLGVTYDGNTTTEYPIRLHPKTPAEFTEEEVRLRGLLRRARAELKEARKKRESDTMLHLVNYALFVGVCVGVSNDANQIVLSLGVLGAGILIVSLVLQGSGEDE